MFKLIGSNKLYNQVLGAVFIFFVFGLGLSLGLSSWNSQLYVETPIPKDSFDQNRGLATQENNLYSTPLDEMNQNIEEKLFKNTRTIQEGKLLGFYLGNFFVPDNRNNSHQFVCQSYRYLEATFTSIGVNVSGEEGSMVILAPCLTESEELIGPFWVPVQQILTNTTKKYFELPERETLIHIYGISFSLVSQWLLTSVRFFNSPEEDGFRVDYKRGSSYFELQTQ